MSTLTTSYQLHRAGPRFGAEVSGVDLTRPVDDDTAEALRRDFITHTVLVFRDQHLSPDQHVTAARIFGEPFDHPSAQREPENRLVYPYDVRETGKGARTWHVGGLWRDPPFSIESLTCQAVSELGGNTLWADLRAAHDDLSKHQVNQFGRHTVVFGLR